MVHEPVDRLPALARRLSQQPLQGGSQVRSGVLGTRGVRLPEASARRVHTQMAVLAKPVEFPGGDVVEQLECHREIDDLPLHLLHHPYAVGADTGRTGRFDLLPQRLGQALAVVRKPGNLVDEVRAHSRPGETDAAAVRTRAVAAPGLRDGWADVRVPDSCDLLLDVLTHGFPTWSRRSCSNRLVPRFCRSPVDASRGPGATRHASGLARQEISRQPA